MHAEDAYLFRHALLRDAAYELFLPLDRAQLHALVVQTLQILCEMDDRLDVADFALELADHCHAVRRLTSKRSDDEITYTRMAALQAERVFDLRQATTLWERAVDAGDTAASTRLHLGRILISVSDVDYACEVLRHGLCLAEELGDDLEAARIWNELGTALRVAGQLDEALECWDHAESRFMRLGSEEALARTRANRAQAYLIRSEHSKAIKALTEASEVLRSSTNKASLPIYLNNLGIAHQRTGNIQLAEQLFVEASELADELGDRNAMVLALGNLSALYQESGKLELAQEYGIAARRENLAIGHLRGYCITTLNLANVRGDQGDLNDQIAMYEEVLPTARELGDTLILAIGLTNYGILCQRAGNLESAADALAEAEALHERNGDRSGKASILNARASLASVHGNHGQAVSLLSESADMYADLSETRSHGETLLQLATEQMHLGDVAGAKVSYQAGIKKLNLVNAHHMVSYANSELNASCEARGIPTPDWISRQASG